MLFISKAYFKDSWLVFDALVIWVSMGLVILNLTYDNS